MAPKNVFYAQSGGVTSVINASAAAVIQTCRKYPKVFGTVYAGYNGILGALREELVDTSVYDDETIESLKYTPGGAFGSCRHKLKNITTHREEYLRLIEVFKAHDIGYFFYNGGGDSQDTAYKVSQISETMGYPITCIGVPKTIDNDLPFTDCCPGFGSVAKYVATSIREAAFDIKSMCNTSTKVFILEVMGRHAGWIAAAGGLAANHEGDAPQIILFPERFFDREAFIERVQKTVYEQGFCCIVASEGIRFADGRFVSESGLTDAFGHAQLGGVAPKLAEMVREDLGYKFHWAVSDYLQRSARHITSQTDLDQAIAVGHAAVELAKSGKNGLMPTIKRVASEPYEWTIGEAPLSEIANTEKVMPHDYISEDSFGITEQARAYLSPLVQGEAHPPYANGLPDYIELDFTFAKKQLPSQFEV